MNCKTVQQQLVELVYDELDADQADAVRRHLHDCEACREQFESLAGTMRLVRSIAAEAESPSGRLSTRGVYQAATKRAERRSRRWRRAAAWSAVAAVLIAVPVVSRARVELHEGFVVFSWGEAGERPLDQQPEIHASETPPAVEPKSDTAGDLPDRQERDRQRRQLDELNTLVKLMVEELNDDDRRFHTAMLVLDRRMSDMERREDLRWSAVGREFHDWHLANAFKEVSLNQPPRKGTQP